MPTPSGGLSSLIWSSKSSLNCEWRAQITWGKETVSISQRQGRLYKLRYVYRMSFVDVLGAHVNYSEDPHFSTKKTAPYQQNKNTNYVWCGYTHYYIIITHWRVLLLTGITTTVCQWCFCYNLNIKWLRQAHVAPSCSHWFWQLWRLQEREPRCRKRTTENLFLGLHSTLCIPEAISVCIFVRLSVCLTPFPCWLATMIQVSYSVLSSPLPQDGLKPWTKIWNRDSD